MTSTAETRDFPTAVVASITTGVLLVPDFPKMHECAEFLMGHPIWTHHFASEELWAQMRAAALSQHPAMPTDAPCVTTENWREFAADLEKKFGATVSIRKGDGVTAMSPLDGIPDGKPVIVVETGATR